MTFPRSRAHRDLVRSLGFVTVNVEPSVELVAVAEYIELESVEVSVELAYVVVDVLVLMELSEELLASVDR